MSRPSDESLEYYRRNLVRQLEALGVPCENGKIETLNHEFETPDQRFRGWLLEALILGIADLRRGEKHMVLRSILQAAQYRGRIGGFWPCPVASDCFIALQNYLEDSLQGKGE